ncbi:SGNH/GDSL hydrolase family protein [Nocardia stercoris]|uniref:SGNH/GDSL hydrolase family protein n=1 Tax=Nocardia stercoris TaxID=2483361 RepID=A0A3M2LG54_9NOCA|nr:SGNH/GDSL hydrolase family protein [Nocardia stercoris]RMI34925.1 SGNH/GDSL hydrolase family protein [Nocardia stercoris]
MKSLTMPAVAMLAATVLAACPVTAYADDTGPGPYREYVALGDSYSADASLSQATAEFVPWGCYQSMHNYPKQIAAALHVPTFRDATCTGAKTTSMAGPQEMWFDTNTPEFDRLSPNTDLVTLQVGANDADMFITIPTCVSTGPAVSPCHDRYVVNGDDAMQDKIRAVEPELVATIAGIRARSPHARILMLDYPQAGPVDHGCYPTMPFGTTDAIWSGTLMLTMNAVIRQVAAETGVEYVDTYTGSAGHDVCQPDGVRWFEGVVPWSDYPVGLAAPLHPNQLGADYQARTVLAAIGQP